MLRLTAGDVYELVIAFHPSPVEEVAAAPTVLAAVVTKLRHVGAAQVIWEADENEDPAIEEASRRDGRTIGVTLTHGPTLAVGVRPRSTPVPTTGPEAYRHPSDMHGRLSTCAACGGTMWPIMGGYPSYDAYENQEQDQMHLGGCVIRYDEPSAVCHACGWAPRLHLL